VSLSDLNIRRAKAAGKTYHIPDADGLALAVSAVGGKAWHLRYYWLGKQKRISLGNYPEIGLREARALRDAARALLAKGVNPHTDRKQKRQVAQFAGEHTFMAVYEKWMAHRRLTLEDGLRSTLANTRRSFQKNVLPHFKRLNIQEITRPMLLEIIGRIERRNALSVAEKLRGWLKRLFDYAMVVIPSLPTNPATDLHVVAAPLPPVRHHPFLRMAQLPGFLQTLRKYPGNPGRPATQLAIRLLLLTGVRTGELRLATPDQFDLERGLWIIPAASLKQRKTLTRKKRISAADIPPYIVPLSVQAREIVRRLLGDFKPAQKYLFTNIKRITSRMGEGTVNARIKRMGYGGRLTGHGIRGTLSTALNELGYPKAWVEAQLSHADPNRISASYNHAEYVEQRRVMMRLGSACES
jgi:integrase